MGDNQGLEHSNDRGGDNPPGEVDNVGVSAPTDLGTLEGDNIPEHIDELMAQHESEAKEVPPEEIILPDHIAPPVHTTRSGRTTKPPAWANDYMFSYLVHGCW